MKNRGAVLILAGSMMLTAFASLVIVIKVAGNNMELGTQLVAMSLPTVGVGILVAGLLRWFESSSQI